MEGRRLGGFAADFTLVLWPQAGLLIRVEKLCLNVEPLAAQGGRRVPVGGALLGKALARGILSPRAHPASVGPSAGRARSVPGEQVSRLCPESASGQGPGILL